MAVPDLSKLGYESYFINGVDLNFPLDYSWRVLSRLLVWDPSIGFGTDRVNNLATVPFWLFNYVLYILSMKNQPVAQALYIALNVSAAFIAIQFFISSYFKSNRIEIRPLGINVAVLTAISIFYSFHPYVFYLTTRLNTHLFVIWLAPYLLGLLLRFGVRISEMPLKHRVSVYLINVIWVPLFSIQPPLLVMLFVLLCLFYFFIIDGNVKGMKRQDTYVVLLLILCHSYWVIPWLNTLISGSYFNLGSFNAMFEVEKLLKYSSNCSSFFGVMTGFADTEWCNLAEFPFWTAPYAVVNSTFYYFIVAFSLYIITTFLRCNIAQKWMLLFIYFIFFIPSMGLNFPFAWLNSFLFIDIPFMGMFRAPWMKLSIPVYIIFSLMLATVYLRFDSSEPQKLD